MSWRENIEDYLSRGPIDLNQMNKNIYKYSGTEPGISHPKKDASIKLRDDGCIDIFAGDNVGIRLDPNAGSVNIFGDKVNLWTSSTSIHTEENSLMWNYNPLNPDMYMHEEDKYLINGTIEVLNEEETELLGYPVYKRVPHNVAPYQANKGYEIISATVERLMKENNIIGD
jgi:hypothetical protein